MRLFLCDSAGAMKPPIEFRPGDRIARKSPPVVAAPTVPKASPAKAASNGSHRPKAKPAKAAKPKKASPPPKPETPATGRAVVARDIPALKERFLAGKLKDTDWDDICALLDSTHERRAKNKAKQQAWRDGKK